MITSRLVRYGPYEILNLLLEHTHIHGVVLGVISDGDGAIIPIEDQADASDRSPTNLWGYKPIPSPRNLGKSCQPSKLYLNRGFIKPISGIKTSLSGRPTNFFLFQ